MARPRKELGDMQFNGWDQLDALILWSDGEYIAWKLGINYDTLVARIKEKFGMGFSDYRDKRREAIKINLRKKQYDTAMAGNVSMLIWLGKNELGQSDKNEEKVISEVKMVIDESDRDL